MNPERVRTTYKRNGLQGAAGDVVYQWSQDVLFLGIFQGMTLRMVDVDAGYLRCGGPCQARFPNTEEVISFAKDPANDLHPTFLQEALAHQDRCFAVLDGDRLASYGWYSSAHADDAWACASF